MRNVLSSLLTGCCLFLKRAQLSYYSHVDVRRYTEKIWDCGVILQCIHLHRFTSNDSWYDFNLLVTLTLFP